MEDSRVRVGTLAITVEISAFCLAGCRKKASRHWLVDSESYRALKNEFLDGSLTGIPRLTMRRLSLPVVVSNK